WIGVAFGGHNIALSDINGTVAGDISPYAGQTGELRISALSTLDRPFTSFSLDSIVFSNQAVPEPRTMVLIIIGFLCSYLRSATCRTGKGSTIANEANFSRR